MPDKITLGTPRITPVAPVGDRAPRPHYPRPMTERVKPKAPPARDEFVATGEKAPTDAGIYTLAQLLRGPTRNDDGKGRM